MPDSVSLLAYFNLSGLLSLGEQVGLAVDPTYTTYAPDLRSLTAAALVGRRRRRSDPTPTSRSPSAHARYPQIDAPPLGGE